MGGDGMEVIVIALAGVAPAAGEPSTATPWAFSKAVNVAAASWAGCRDGTGVG
jgi:hypothetical protein